jgi:hypothetical protein
VDDWQFAEIDYSHNVELSVPAESVGATLKGLIAFHRERGIEQHRGRSFSRDGRYAGGALLTRHTLTRFGLSSAASAGSNDMIKPRSSWEGKT